MNSFFLCIHFEMQSTFKIQFQAGIFYYNINLIQFIMTHSNNPGAAANKRAAYMIPMLIGGVIAFTLISMLVFSVNEPPPEWGNLWMVQPLIVTPVVGAMGGLFYFFANYIGAKWGLNKYLSVIVGVFGFIIALWMGIVLGLNGTMWN